MCEVSVFDRLCRPIYATVCSFVSLFMIMLSSVHTGEKVEISTVDCWKSTFFGPVHTLATKSTVSATKSTATSCRIHVVADLLPKPATKLNVGLYGNSRLCCRFVAGFGSSWLSTKSSVHVNFVQCVPGFTGKLLQQLSSQFEILYY